MTPGPTRRGPWGRRTTRMKGCSRAAASAMAPVPSLLPSSTMIQRAGLSAWAAIEATVLARYCSSSLTGLMIRIFGVR